MTETIARTPSAPETPGEPDWSRCAGCGILMYHKRLDRTLGVCPECGHHHRVAASRRLAWLLDEGSQQRIEPPMPADDPLEFTDVRPYAERLAAARAATGLDEAVICASGTIKGDEVIVAAMDFRYMGGSLGSAVGEAITVAAEAALARRLPFIMITASGGARMQEGALSLMQMAKTTSALSQLDEAGVLTIALITDPTYGGVAASFAALTDVIIAEPGARMGFAGPRVIEQTVGAILPEGFQTAEFLLTHGLIDDVRSRGTQRAAISHLVSMGHQAHRTAWPVAGSDPLIRDTELLPDRVAADVVRASRDVERPTFSDYAANALDAFAELHGDRVGDDDPAVIGGLGWIDGRPVMLIGHQKGHTPRELVDRNFGRARPGGHRKAARLMRLAAKLGIPVVTLIDTSGAEPGIAAEEQGQLFSVAANLGLMAALEVPIVAVVTGEGGSGGALAFGVADQVLICENATYSVISPEGCAAILWRDSSAAPDAAASLQVDARSLLGLQVVDGVIPEPPSGAAADHVSAAAALRGAVTAALAELAPLDHRELLERRRTRFRRYGQGRRS
jgi:acetyl-CoA carboxylase carboxyl transferase subunit beta